MNKVEKVKNFQIRWKEPLGEPNCPYMVRWVLILFGYSIRLHHWIRSDDKRFFHDHPWNFLTIILKGSYTDVSPSLDLFLELQEPIKEILKRGDFKFRKAEHKHYVVVPPDGCWTLLFCGKYRRKWGFWIKVNQFFRPLRYFNKYGHPPCSEQ